MKLLKSNTKIALAIFLLAMILSVIGFLVDSDPREPSLALNLFEVSMMTLILFTFISIPFVITIGLSKLFKKT